MIVPMKKITLVVLNRERSEALIALRKLGVLHVEQRESSSAALTDMQARLAAVDQSLQVLGEYAKKNRVAQSKDLSVESAQAAVARVIAVRDEKKNALDGISKLEREIERTASWGDVDPKTFAFLAGKGVYFGVYEFPAEEYLSLGESIRTIRISSTKKSVRCVVLRDGPQENRVLSVGAREFIVPEKSSEQLRAELAVSRASLAKFDESLIAELVNADAIRSLRQSTLKDIQFESIRAGMSFVPLADENSALSTSHVAWLSGFMPVSEVSVLDAASKRHGWAYISEDPSDDDIVPTKIKNNRFVNLISPLLDFLGTVPGYREIDISLWFLLFFGVFFAMIFGDGGYGSLMVLLALGGIVSFARKGKEIPTGLYMFLYLGAMTVGWGTVTCTWFGLSPEILPSFLTGAAIPAFKNGNPDAAKNIQVFCFSLGLAQLSIAHLIGIARNIKTPKFLGELGSLLMLVGMFNVVLNLVVDAQRFPLPTWAAPLIGAGFVLNFVFANYAGKIGAGILESLKNIITMCLGVVNVFGDIMSYIRLWAVGLAGAAISNTVNTMAGPVLGGFILFLGVILLVFGHGLNFILNVLSVIVHGVRLNTLEFSNHLGLTWSGFKYEPFSETANK